LSSSPEQLLDLMVGNSMRLLRQGDRFALYDGTVRATTVDVSEESVIALLERGLISRAVSDVAGVEMYLPTAKAWRRR
jgi:hypothetical protein